MRAGDLEAKLYKDPKHKELTFKREKKIDELRVVYAEDQKELLQELKVVGYRVSSVWDFVNNNVRYSFLRTFSGTYERAYPILAKHLKMKHHSKVREGIIRALTEKDANVAASDVLIEEFKTEKDPNLKWVIANAMRTVLIPAQKKKHPEYKDYYKNPDKP